MTASRNSGLRLGTSGNPMVRNGLAAGTAATVERAASTPAQNRRSVLSSRSTVSQATRPGCRVTQSVSRSVLP